MTMGRAMVNAGSAGYGCGCEEFVIQGLQRPETAIPVVPDLCHVASGLRESLAIGLAGEQGLYRFNHVGRLISHEQVAAGLHFYPLNREGGRDDRQSCRHRFQ